MIILTLKFYYWIILQKEIGTINNSKAILKFKQYIREKKINNEREKKMKQKIMDGQTDKEQMFSKPNVNGSWKER